MGGSMRGASCRRASVRWMGGALIASALLAALVAAAADETVVSGEWTVVYPKSPYATKGLQDGLSKMSVALCECLEESVGVKAVAVDDTKMPSAPGRRFFIGEKFAKIAGLMPADFRSYDWGIAEKNGDIYIFGAAPAGTIYGVHAFLENNTDLIWAYPDSRTYTWYYGLIAEPGTFPALLGPGPSGREAGGEEPGGLV